MTPDFFPCGRRTVPLTLLKFLKRERKGQVPNPSEPGVEEAK